MWFGGKWQCEVQEKCFHTLQLGEKKYQCTLFPHFGPSDDEVKVDKSGMKSCFLLVINVLIWTREREREKYVLSRIRPINGIKRSLECRTLKLTMIITKCKSTKHQRPSFLTDLFCVISKGCVCVCVWIGGGVIRDSTVPPTKHWIVTLTRTAGNPLGFEWLVCEASAFWSFFHA